MGEEKQVSELTKKRLLELSDRSYRGNICVFSDFLDLAAQTDLGEIQGRLSPCGLRLWGGYEEAERVMAGFGTKEVLGYEEPFPIAFLLVRPVAEKFAEDLSHRDFLGALMNLGLERDRIGDLVLSGDRCVIICTEAIADFICTELSRVRHTPVVCRRIDSFPAEFVPKREEVRAVVSSVRLDSVVAKAANLSRGKAAELFTSGKIQVNGRETGNVSYTPKEGDTISMRGYGKIRFLGTGGETKKGRIVITYEKFV